MNYKAMRKVATAQRTQTKDLQVELSKRDEALRLCKEYAENILSSSEADKKEMELALSELKSKLRELQEELDQLKAKRSKEPKQPKTTFSGFFADKDGDKLKL